MSQDTDLLKHYKDAVDVFERYIASLNNEVSLRQQRREAISVKNYKEIKELSDKILVAEQLTRELKTAIEELETVEIEEKSANQIFAKKSGLFQVTKPNRRRVLWGAGLVAALLALFTLAWAINQNTQTLLSTPTPTIPAVVQHHTPTATLTTVSVVASLTPTPTSTLTSTPSPTPTISATTSPTPSTLVVAVSNSYLPFSFVNPATNMVEGFDIDIVTEICERLDCIPEFRETAWEGMLQAVANGEYDIAADGISIVEDRSEIVDFSTAYLQLFHTIFIRNNEQRFHNIDELTAGGFTIGVYPESYLVATSLVSEDRVMTFENLEVAVEALASGEVDAIIADNLTTLPGSVKMLDESLKLAPQELAFAFPPSSDLIESVNEAISNIRSDGTLVELYYKWVSHIG